MQGESVKIHLSDVLMTADPVRAVALVSALVVVPLRAWTLATDPDHVLSMALQPQWFQTIAVLVFLLLGIVALARPLRWVGIVALSCFVVSAASSAMSFVADPRSGQGVFWAVKALVCLWLVYRCAYRRGYTNGAR